MKFHALRNSPLICLSLFDYTDIIQKRFSKMNDITGSIKAL